MASRALMPSILNTVRDLGRLREIASVMARHGFGELVQRTGLGGLVPGRREEGSQPTSTAVRIRQVLEELGPSFIKLGQILSTRPDLVPEDILTELKRLQDDVPPVPFADVRPAIEEQLGAPIAALFSSFDETPIASASIGQVYRARLSHALAPSGEEETNVDVVVKVQRPNIAATIERDIDLLYWLAHAIARSMPEAQLYAPVKLVEQFDQAIRAELDFTLEADNAERFAADFADLQAVSFPRVFRSASSRKVITLSFIPGEKVLDAVAHGASGEHIAKTIVQVMVRMIFEHGFFHADPHPGNVLITGDPSAPVVGLIDLGLVGRLTSKLRDRLIDLLLAVGREDPRAIADALYAIGRPTKKIDRTAYEAEVTRLADKYLRKSLQDIAFSELIRDLVGAAVRYGIEVPADFTMVGKALMTMEGIGRQIHPRLNVAEEVRPYLAQVLSHRYSPERMTSDLMHLLNRFSASASELPGLAEEILEDLRRGRLTLEVKQSSMQHAYERLGRRIFASTLLSASLITGGILVSHGQAPLGWGLLGGAAFLGSLNALALALGKYRPPR
jgi:ubiquinone biosynthesis protein